MKDYPINTGDYNYSFMYNVDDWKERLFSDKSNQTSIASTFGEYIKTLSDANIQESQEGIITQWLSQTTNTTNDLYFFVKYFVKMNYFKDNQGNVKFADGNWGRQLCIKDPKLCQIIYSSYNNYRDIYLYGDAWLVSGEKSSNWKRIECYKDDSYVCLYTDFYQYDVAIDLTIDDNGQKGRMCLFNREPGNGNHLDLSDIFDLPMFVEANEEGNRHYTPWMPVQDVLENFLKIKKGIEKKISK